MSRTWVKVLVVSLLVALFLWVTGSLHRDSRFAYATACLVGGLLVAVTLLMFRRTGRALKDREALLHAFTGALPDAGFILDEDGRYVEVMTPADGLLLKEAEGKRGRRMHDFFAPETADRFVAEIRRTIETNRSQTVEYEVQTEVGPRRFEGRTSPIRGRREAGKRLVVWIARDVTDRAVLEEQLRQAEKMHAIGQLAGGLAHDFNNQLGGIMGYADILSRRGPDEDGLVSGIVRAARRAADLTQQLLAFSRKGKYLSEPVDMRRAIEEVIALLGRSIDKRITIRTDFNAMRPFVVGDPTQLQSALLNLALNARDAMPDGGELTFTIADHDSDTMRIAVQDTGVGMEEETSRRMFEPFFTTKEQGRGTGMGLAAVFGTVETHGGTIDVFTREGQGTRIEVDLPSTSRVAAEESVTTSTVGPASGGCILVVDDEPAIRDVASEMLRELGYDVLLAEDGTVAVDRIRSDGERIDLVLLDLVMPVLDGRETFKQLRKLDPAVRVVLSSGYSVNGKAEGMMREGALGFIQKPYQLEDLGTIVGAALES